MLLGFGVIVIVVSIAQVLGKYMITRDIEALNPKPYNPSPAGAKYLQA